jgi:uncharacterized protein (DUF1778 family)
MSKTPHKSRTRREASRPVRSAWLQVRLAADEKAAFVSAAAIDGKGLSEWLRDRLRRDARQELEAHGQTVPFLPSKEG